MSAWWLLESFLLGAIVALVCVTKALRRIVAEAELILANVEDDMRAEDMDE